MGYAFAGFGSRTPDFLTQSARNVREKLDSLPKSQRPAVDAEGLLTSRRATTAVLSLSTGKRPKVKAGRKANRLRLMFQRRR